MGFSGGGSNVLKSHTHDGTIAQDGGSLNMDNVTQAALTSGDLVYSDGIHLQRLAIGGSGESLTSSGTVPQWAAASGASVELISTQELGSDTSSMTHSWSAVDFDDYACVTVFFNGWIQNAGTDLFIRLQNPVLTGTDYYSERFVVASGSSSASSLTQDRITLPTNSRSYRGRIDITAADSTNTDDRCLQWFLQCTCTSANALVLQSGYYTACNVTPVTESTGIYYTPAGGNLKAGWFSSAYKYSRT